jgi:hypothetical protein
MPRYEVRSLDTWGNSVDGYEGNNSHRLGEVFISTEATGAFVVEALIEAGHLNREAVRMFELGDLELDDQGDMMELSEAENEWHAIPAQHRRGAARELAVANSGRRLLLLVPSGETIIVSPADTAASGGLPEVEVEAILADPDVMDNADLEPNNAGDGDARILDAENREQAEEQLEEGEEAEEVVTHRPFMSLMMLLGRHEAVPFLRQKIGSSVLELRVDPKKLVRETKRGTDFEIDTYVDGDFYDTFLLTRIDGEVLGIDKKGEEITGNEELIATAKVAMDAFLERGGEGHSSFVPSKESLLSEEAKQVLYSMRLNDDQHNRGQVAQEEYLDRSRKLWERARALKVDLELAGAMSR